MTARHLFAVQFLWFLLAWSAIAVLLVPLMAVSHVMVFVTLLRER